MPDLQIERDDRYLAAERVAHRVVVLIMGLVVGAGALGVFGFGPLASSTRVRDGVQVTYDRFGRNGAPLHLEVTTRGSEVHLGDGLLDAVQIERITPAPSAERRVEHGIVFTFDTPDGVPTTATFDLTGDAVGVVDGRVGQAARAGVAVRIIFYP